MTKFQVINEEKIRKAILVGLRTTQAQDQFDAAMKELAELAKAAGMEPVLIETQNAVNPTQATYIGKGKVEEVKDDIKFQEADVVIFDQMLSPMQFRNLNRELELEVIDRTGLILQIFSEQAKTREAALQVEHARLQYILPRLAGMWTHFGRQAGSSGSQSNRGVGEKQIELDRRHIERRMSELEKELKNIQRERMTQREKRLQSPIPRIALVGYTNAGKSTIMNHLLDRNEEKTADGKKVYEKDKLFATLDTTVRKIAPKGHRAFLLSDTVGFINELPHSLVKAFRSTLEEVKYADLLLEVIDFSDPNFRTCMKVTEETLREIGAGDIPILYVFNKTDLVQPITNEDGSIIEEDSWGAVSFNRSDVKMPYIHNDQIYLSAKQEVGLSELLDLIEEKLSEQFVFQTILLPYDQGGVLNRLLEQAEVTKTEYREDGILIEARMSPAEWERLRQYRLDS